MPQQLVFNIGITCQGCVPTVHSALRNIDFLKYGLSNQRIDLTQTPKKLYIDFDPTQTELTFKDAKTAIIEALDELGITCEIHSIDKPRHSYHWLLGSVGLSAGLGLMLLAFFTGGLSFPLMVALGLSSTALTVVLGYQSFVNAYVHARYSQTLTMDTLFTISTISILAVSLGAFFIPGLPMMFEAGLMLFGFRHIGLGIEEAINQTSGVQQHFTDRLPKTVTLDEGKTIETSQIQPNDILILNPGDVLPVDGCFIDVTPSVHNVIRTGNDRPYLYAANQTINSGAIIDGESDKHYLFKAKATVADSYLAKLDNLLLSAQQNKAPVENYTNQLLNYFIPGVLALAILSGLVIGVWISPIMAVQCAAAVLVTACPCTLGMIVPITMKIGMQKGLNHGVAFKSREAIEQASQIGHIVFDLNGTLTQGKPEIRQCQYDHSISAPYLWQIVYQLEHSTKHPVGKCLSNYALTQLKGPVENRFSDIEVEEMHNGCKASIQIMEQSLNYCIGNAQFMRDNGIDVVLKNKEPRIYLSENNRIIASFVVVDPLRKGAAGTVQQLQSNGKAVYLLTGADKGTAQFYANLLKINPDNVFANQAPEDKQQQIKALQTQGLVAMVGDGGNDAIALQQSDLGIVINSPFSDVLADQQAHVVISDQSLLPVEHIFQVANQTMSILKQNLWFSFGYNAAALLLTGGILAAIGFAMNPAIGAALMVLQTSMILLNTYRLPHQELPSHQPAELNELTAMPALSQLSTSPGCMTTKQSYQASLNFSSMEDTDVLNSDQQATPITLPPETTSGSETAITFS